MLAAMDPREFDEWWAMWRIEPWGDEWRQTATLTAMIHNVNCTSHADAISADELMPGAQLTRRTLSPEESEAKARARHGGR